MTEQKLSEESVNLIRKTYAKEMSGTDFDRFLYQCNRTGLDPLLKQIYWIVRGGKGTVQVGIDGYRCVADRTGAYAGNDDPVYGSLTEKNYPSSATVTVYKIVQGIRCPFTATARWEEYYPGDGAQSQMWRKMPHNQLAKCAEALALRKAFPDQLSGIYTDTEMEQAGRVEMETGEIQDVQPSPIPPAKKEEVWATMTEEDRLNLWWNRLVEKAERLGFLGDKTPQYQKLVRMIVADAPKVLDAATYEACVRFPDDMWTPHVEEANETIRANRAKRQMEAIAQ